MRLANEHTRCHPTWFRSLKRLVPGERSSFLAKLIEEWLAEREREELCRRVVEGCRDMAELYEEIDGEWRGVSEEVWRGAD